MKQKQTQHNMTTKISVEFFPRHCSMIGISYDEGESKNLETEEVLPIHKVSIGLLIVMIDFMFFVNKKGEK